MKRVGLLVALALALPGVVTADDSEQAKQIERWQRLTHVGAKYGPQVVAWAQFNLGVSYLNGDGVVRDEDEAAWWLRNSAERGYAPAQFALAKLYQEGRGVQQNAHEAAFWFRMAASQGHGRAQSRLSYMYANGIGVGKNAERAQYWAQRAAAAGVPSPSLAVADVGAGP